MTYLHKTITRHFTTFTVYIFSNIPRKLGRLKALEIPPVLHPFLEIWPVCIRQKHATSQLLQFIFSVTFQENSEDLDPVYMEWGNPVWWGRFLLFCPPQSVKTKETNPTRPGSPTPCKQALKALEILPVLLLFKPRSTAWSLSFVSLFCVCFHCCYCCVFFAFGCLFFSFFFQTAISA